MEKHKMSIEQLIHRDRNHASVVMWSIANEPRTKHFNADQYFELIAKYTKELDPTRPITAAIAQPMQEDKAVSSMTLDKSLVLLSFCFFHSKAQHLDIISFNRYNGWYQNPGKLNMIRSYVYKEAKGWHELHNKPVLMSEYGSDTAEGLHMLPAFVWSEEYQAQQFSKHFEAFDQLRNEGFFIGEFVWNFADFKTAQSELFPIH